MLHRSAHLLDLKHEGKDQPAPNPKFHVVIVPLQFFIVSKYESIFLSIKKILKQSKKKC